MPKQVSMRAMFIAKDQYGNTYHALKHPRKDLCVRLGNKHAEKLYVDKADGTAVHVGYVIGGLWLRVYRVLPWH